MTNRSKQALRLSRLTLRELSNVHGGINEEFKPTRNAECRTLFDCPDTLGGRDAA
jgi:hypothetical protein